MILQEMLWSGNRIQAVWGGCFEKWAGDAASASPFPIAYRGLDDGVVELLGVLVFGVDWEFGVVDVPFGVVVAPLEVDPGVIVPLLLLVPVVSVELPVFEDWGTADPLAGTQSALAVLVVPGAAVVLVDVVPVVEELLGDVLLLELGIELEELLGEVLVLELGEVLLELGEVLLVELLGVEVVVLVDPVAFALVRGTMPAGQLLLVEEALGLVELAPVEDPVCEEDGIVELLPVELPVCDEVEGVVELLPVVSCDPVEEVEGEVVVVVVLVVEEVCAAAHVAHAVRTRIVVNFFMFFCPRVSSGYLCDAHSSVQVRPSENEKRAGAGPAPSGRD
ncbi:MAG: hypothetical protein ACJ71N_06695 [Terriglobales bacterium]